jgi:hypothetical protein
MITPIVTIPEYWALPENERPTTFEAMCDLLLPRDGISGFWCVRGTVAGTDEVISEIWTPNAITDNGAQYAIGNLFYATGAAYSPMNVMCISTDAGSTTLTTALTITATTSLAVAALPAAIASGTTLKLDYSTGSEETCVTSALANAGATSISVTSFTPAFTHAIGKTVVPVALPSDNPSGTPTGGTYLSLVAGDYGAISGSGQGLRTRTITKKFPGASTTAATYTWCRLANANPIVSGAVGASCIVPQAVINSTTDQTFVVVIKL